MPVNLPPQYHQKESELKTAKTLEEKISILEELLAIMPKHKSSEKLQALLKTKIAKYRKVIEKGHQIARRTTIPIIKREGAGQLAICGPTNSGKSTLLSVITKAKPQIADYPYTTKLPLPGMMPYSDINIQLLDTPSLSPEFSENWMGDILRKTDALLFIFDISSDTIIEDMDGSMKVLEKFRIKDEQQFSFAKNILWIANKIDLPGYSTIRGIFKELYGEKIPDFVEISAKEGTNTSCLPEKIFNTLGIIRIYTKIPGKPPDLKNPYTIKKDSTLIELAEIIHKDLVQNFKYARLWRHGESNAFVAGRDYILADRDIIEIHTG